MRSHVEQGTGERGRSASSARATGREGGRGQTRYLRSASRWSSSPWPGRSGTPKCPFSQRGIPRNRSAGVRSTAVLSPPYVLPSITSLQSQLTAANATIATQSATITSFVNDLFGQRPDANVAAAARDAAQAKINQAIAAVGTSDRRVQRAQRNFNEGLAALAAGNFSRAVREFRQAFEIASRILGA